MANTSPSWAEIQAIQAIIFRRLLAVDKMPRIWPLSCGKIWCRIFVKVPLIVSMLETEIECGTEQLCGGLHSGIEGGAHGMKTMWRMMQGEEEMWFILIDACNAFNEANWTKIPWTIRHLWPIGARFTHNCYRHNATLYLRSTDC